MVHMLCCFDLGGINDYNQVTEHQSMDTCLLGYSNVYNLTKEDIV